MQQSDGSMRILTEKEIVETPNLVQDPKVVKEGRYFKIKHCYFKIIKITLMGIEARGVSRREYFENR